MAGINPAFFFGICSQGINLFMDNFTSTDIENYYNRQKYIMECSGSLNKQLVCIMVFG